MKKIALVLFTVLTVYLLDGCQKEQTVRQDRITFEDLSPGTDSFGYGDTVSGGFYEGNAFFPVHFDYGIWSGFAISTRTDDTTRGYSNLYSSIAGEGAGHSNTYAVYYCWQTDTIVFSVPEKISNLAVCNSTYAYYSMLEGDQFSKKFGGTDGTDPDYFKLIIDGFDGQNNKVIEASVMLADFTFDDSSMDYISNAWTEIDLSEAGFLKYLVLSFDSSDRGPDGIYTPKLVCLDNIAGELQE